MTGINAIRTNLKIVLFFLFVMVFLSKQNAQQSIYHQQKDIDFIKGQEYLEKEQYSTAQKLFESVYNRYNNTSSELRTLSQYYMAYCAVRLFNEDAEYLTTEFVASNPESQLINDAYFNLAGYFYARKKWDKSINYYERVDPDRLTEEQWAEYYFKIGYAYFSKEQFDKAKIAFYRIIDIDTKYTAPALYYYSHIHYNEKNYQTALNGFLRLTGDKTFGPIAPYYIVQIYYLQSRYKEIIDFVPGIIHKVSGKRLAEISRITAEAYAQQGKFEESLPYYQTFLDSADVVGDEDKYQAGYAFYKSDKYDNAIDLFSSIASGMNLIAQDASYYLADCYIHVNQKQKARMAFQSAASMDFDLIIKQDALFNYALLTYELSNDPFNESVRSFDEFIRLYPESKRVDEAYKYLILSYLKVHNYRLAIESLDKTNLQSNDLKKAYQRVAFFRGVELFIDQDYQQAIDLFDKSLKYDPYDQSLKARAIYWKGEAYYRTGEYQDAIKYFNDFHILTASATTTEYAKIDYDLGYAYFRIKNYQDAIESFKKFESIANKDLVKEKGDALDRIGDCYYTKADYSSASEYYGQAVNSSIGIEYALLQKGICEGLLNKDEQKISTLQKLIKEYPQSGYTDNALFESAQSSIKLQNIKQGIDKLTRLVAEYSQGKYTADAYMQLGLQYYNLDNNAEAIRYYKEAITRFPGTQAARDALSGLKTIYIEINKVDDYLTFVKSLNSATPIVSVNEQDSLNYISAEKLYNTGNYDGAAKAFEHYLSNFPKGSYLLDANFYKGDCNYRNKEFDKALESFYYILDQSLNSYTEQALLGSARIEIDKKDYDKAIEHYSHLIDSFPTPENNKESSIALMQCYFIRNNYEEALKWVQDVEKINKIGPETMREANFIAGRAFQETGRDALAIEEYKKLAMDVKSKEGAEAKFHLAELYFKIKEFDKAEKEILDFSQKSSPYDYWIARSFILWADIFVEKKDYFQALQTLQSIIDYYVNKDDGILKMAADKKAEIEKIQAKPEQSKENKDAEVNVE